MTLENRHNAGHGASRFLGGSVLGTKHHQDLLLDHGVCVSAVVVDRSGKPSRLPENPFGLLLPTTGSDERRPEFREQSGAPPFVDDSRV